jgi:hypothetical protein
MSFFDETFLDDARKYVILLMRDQKSEIQANLHYMKRLVSRINPSLLLKMNVYNAVTLQLNNINQMKSYTKDN